MWEKKKKEEEENRPAKAPIGCDAVDVLFLFLCGRVLSKAISCVLLFCFVLLLFVFFFRHSFFLLSNRVESSRVESNRIESNRIESNQIDRADSIPSEFCTASDSLSLFSFFFVFPRYKVVANVLLKTAMRSKSWAGRVAAVCLIGNATERRMMRIVMMSLTPRGVGVWAEEEGAVREPVEKGTEKSID